jgi:hypothetical protein
MRPATGVSMRGRDSTSPTPLAAVSQASVPADSTSPGSWLERRHSRGEEQVLGEIAHELGNFFHKLYYWAEFLQEARADHSADATAAQMLTRTVAGLEEFLKATLEYFRPLKLSPVPMPVVDAVGGMVVQLRAQLHGWPVRLGEAVGLRSRRILVDAARLPAVFLAIGRRLTERAPAGSGVHIGIEARREEFEIAFRVEGGLGSAGFQTAESCIEWALAERIVALHGGRLDERDGVDGPPVLVLTLPFHGE